MDCVCELGNINGCPRYPNCQCQEHLRARIRDIERHDALVTGVDKRHWTETTVIGGEE